MIIEVNYKTPYIIFRIKDDLDNRSDLTGLRSLVKKYLANGDKYYAFTFSSRSLFFPSSISIIVQCAELIKEQEGSLSIVEASSEILDMIASIDIDQFISTFRTEEEMLFHLSPSLRKK